MYHSVSKPITIFGQGVLQVCLREYRQSVTHPRMRPPVDCRPNLPQGCGSVLSQERILGSDSVLDSAISSLALACACETALITAYIPYSNQSSCARARVRTFVYRLDSCLGSLLPDGRRACARAKGSIPATASSCDAKDIPQPGVVPFPFLSSISLVRWSTSDRSQRTSTSLDPQ